VARNLKDLSSEVKSLAADYRELREQYPASGNLGSILNKTWYPPAEDAEPDRLAAFRWAMRLREYLIALYQFFVESERPETLSNFPLLDWLAPEFTDSQTFTAQAVLRSLDWHVEQLNAEAQRRDPHRTLRQLILEAMRRAEHGIGEAADKMIVERGTLGDFLSEKRDNLQFETKFKMSNYVLKYCPEAKPQITELGL